MTSRAICLLNFKYLLILFKLDQTRELYLYISGNQSSDLYCPSLLIEDVNSGWVAWKDSIVAYACPHVSKPSLPPWDPESQVAIAAVREAAGDSSFWRNLSVHFSSETHSEVVSSDNVASIKSIGMFSLILKILTYT